MRHFIHFLFLLSVLGISSCSSNRKLIEKSQTEFGRLKFYATTTGGKSIVDKVYADVDSNGIKMFYSFYPDRIVMTDERAKELSYTILFKQLPDQFDTNFYRQLSQLDMTVLSKAKTILKTSSYSHLKNPIGSTGFEIEVNYMHGFPKNRKFQPL